MGIATTQNLLVSKFNTKQKVRSCLLQCAHLSSRTHGRDMAEGQKSMKHAMIISTTDLDHVLRASFQMSSQTGFYSDLLGKGVL